MVNVSNLTNVNVLKDGKETSVLLVSISKIGLQYDDIHKMIKPLI